MSSSSGPNWAPGYRHLTDAPPISLRYKARPEDFVVEELPARAPSGDGEFCWLYIEKRSLATIDAARRLADAFKMEPRRVGFAGRKDVRAVTRQWFSVHGVTPEAARDLPEAEDLRVLDAARSDSALRSGNLTGNRFRLKLDDVAEQDWSKIEAGLRALEGGVPNYFGEQRFGRQGNNHELGRALAMGEEERYLELFLSGESAASDELLRRSREGSWSERRKANELRCSLDPDRGAVAKQLARRPKDLSSLVRSIPKRTRKFHLSALQSYLFHLTLTARLDAGYDVRVGDRVRADRGFELVTGLPESRTPSGPLPGKKLAETEGEPRQLEEDALAPEAEIVSRLATLTGPLATPGTRRPYLVPVRELEVTPPVVSFVLPPGAYATTVLEELQKKHS